MFVSWLEADTQSRRIAVGDAAIAAGAMVVELALIVAISILTGIAWHHIAYHDVGDIASYASIGALAGLLYTLPFLFRAQYRVDALTSGPRSTAHILNIWTYAFFCLGTLAFLTKTTGDVSRGWLGLFFVLGGAGVVAGSKLVEAMVAVLVAKGIAAPRRVLVVGNRDDVTRFAADNSIGKTGISVAAVTVLPEAKTPSASEIDVAEHLIREAVQRSRSLNVSDVVILSRCGETHFELANMANRFLDLPVGVHLAKLSLTEQFPNISVGHVGSSRTLMLRKAPLSTYQLAAKRTLDLVLGMLGLIALLPLFLIVAVLIKLDSKGPVFFRQRRRGFNLKEFAIWKFRTMSTLDDGDTIVQAQANDARITRIGAMLRRFNIDELPQLINVVLGDMSLVGPRPHAVAHDRHYEQIIRRYQRRLNVKPGITGWAQVNGYRGITQKSHAMRSRIAHDLFYIDNWSLAFDLYIMALTVISPKAFRNAN